jgi:hypothetical protein
MRLLITPSGRGLFAEENSMALIGSIPRRFWRPEFSRLLDNKKGDFNAEADSFTPSEL